MAEGDEVVTCLICWRLLGASQFRGRLGRGTAHRLEFECPCGAEVSVIARRPLTHGDALIDYRRP